MFENSEYIPKEERKNILLLADDLRLSSGVGNMSKEIVLKSAHHYNWVNLGAAIKHPDKGKVFDLSGEVNKMTGLEDSSVKVIPNDGYGNAQRLREVLTIDNFDAIMIFTDPRYWIWLYEMEREIRSKMPLIFLTIWDDLPAPLYNKSYYESCDLLMCISKQTKNIVKMVLNSGDNPPQVIDLDQ